MQKHYPLFLYLYPHMNEQVSIIKTTTRLYFIYFNNSEIAQRSVNRIWYRQAKSKILDLAIRGKLVPQDPNDEPASVLLERIRAEKEELIKAGQNQA